MERKQRFSLVPLAAAFALAAGEARATDLVVDASGAGGAHRDIDAAMAVALPGDRILVQPGTYPQFDFTVGVSVIGLGADPAAVVIRKIYFHVNAPSTGYDALLQNVTLHSDDAADTLLLHGNEAAPGSLTVDGVRIDGAGVYLRGGQEGFYVHFSNSEIRPKQGYGFSGEACYVGGPNNFVEVRNTRIVGWTAWPAFGLKAGVGLRIAGGTQARVIGSEISGGAGAASADPALAAGGDGISYGLTGASTLLLDGGSVIRGGDGVGGKGGDGVEFDGTIALGRATVSGGAGSPPGEDFSLDDPLLISADLALAVTPDLKFAEGEMRAKSGDLVTFKVNTAGPALLAIGFAVDVPASQNLFFPLSPMGPLFLVSGDEFTDAVPDALPGEEMQGVMVYAQAFFLDPVSGKLALTNAATLRVDLL